MPRPLFAFFSALAVFAVPAFCNAAEDYPGRPLRFLVPFPAGGGTDGMARILGTKLTEMWGQQVIIDNRAGAQGNIGGEFWHGGIGSVLIFDRALAPEELQIVWNYFDQKYGIAKQEAQADSALTSLCHVLLNANEFLFID